jgi:hypothetical protein
MNFPDRLKAIARMKAEAAESAKEASTQSFDLLLSKACLQAQITTETAVFQINGRDTAVSYPVRNAGALLPPHSKALCPGRRARHEIGN